MMSMAIDRNRELAPHANRSMAMAVAISLNLALVLVALRPEAPPMFQPVLPHTQIATLDTQPPPPPKLPALPTLRLAPHVTAPVIAAHATHVLATTVTEHVAATTTLPVHATATTGPTTPAVVADSDATIAYASASPPAYPLAALRAGVQGTVLLDVLVDAQGKPMQVKVQRSSGSRDLDGAARLHVLAAWRFHPAVRDGHAIAAWVLVPVKFDLHNL